jgi:DnaK suppressor protein
MNATVTKSAKKSVAKKPVPGAKSRPAVKATAKSAAKSSLKAAAGKLVKKLASALKPGTKPAKTAAAAKPVKKAVKPAAKAVKPAAKTGAKTAAAKKAVGKVPAAKATKAATRTAAGTPAKPAAKAAPAQTARPVPTLVKPASVVASAISQRGNQSGNGMSGNKASPALADKIHNTVVSKVSEVATKTTKQPTPITTDGTLLTEAQILKMGEADYMNSAQLAFFKARLQQLERDLLRNAGETTEHLRETVLVPDPADRATIEEEHALELRTRDRERKLLKKVQQSLASIDSGDYGWCEETGEPIGIPRLLARPTATLSLEAQQRRELKQKLYGD